MGNIIILGCGSSGGVPRIDGYWGVCDPDHPKNRRSRCSILVQIGDKNILVDTSPDMRMQLLRENISHIDAVLYTHDHADQTHGIDDIRAYTFVRQETIPAYADCFTGDILLKRFDYIFHSKAGSGYPAIMSLNTQPCDFHITDFDLPIKSFDCIHGQIIAKGFIIGSVAYSPDVNDFKPETLQYLTEQKLSCWIVDCLRYTPHPTHAHYDRVMEWFDIVRPQKMILTNLHFDLDYETLMRKLPDNISPAYDGMRVAL